VFNGHVTRIAELLAAGPTRSFEFAPPRDEEGARRLEKVLHELEPLHPSYVSVTYGAGGSTRVATRQVVEHIHRDTSMTVMPHLTCVAQTRPEIRALVEGYRDAGIDNLLALAGDPPVGDEPVSSDFHYAVELIELARGVGEFSIGVAAFPEGHPRSPDLATDRRHLADKLRLADFGVTQFFFSVDDYLRMVDDLAALGVDTPVLPGLMLFVNVDGLRRMAAVNGTNIPDDLQRRLDLVAGTPAKVRDVAVDVTAELCAELLERGAPGVHLYTMNFSSACHLLYERLGWAAAR
jgi:methylenetetrahydrofolate reductase (NADPH)